MHLESKQYLVETHSIGYHVTLRHFHMLSNDKK